MVEAGPVATTTEPRAPGGDAASGGTAQGEAAHGRAPIEARAVRSFMWSALSFGGNRVLLFVATVVLARILVPGEFGVVAAGLALVLYFEIALDLGVGAALVYEQEQGITPRVQTAFTANLLVSIALTAVGVAAAPAVASFFRVPGEDAIFRALFLYLLIRGAGVVPDAVLKRDLRFGRRALADVSRGAVRLAVSVPLALLGHGTWSLVWGLLAGELTGTAVTWLLVRFRPTMRLDRSALRSLLGYGFAVLALKVVDSISLDADYLVVGHARGPEQLGLYSMAYRLPELLLTNVYWIFSSVAFPIYARVRATAGDAFASTMFRALRLITLFSFPAGVGLALVARDVIPLLFSDTWTPAVRPMELLALAAAFNALGYASGDIFPALGRPGTLLALNVPATVLLVAGFIGAAPHGIAAVAAVHLVGNAVYGGIRLVIAGRLVGCRFGDNLRAMRPGLCAATGVVACALPVRLGTGGGAVALIGILTAGLGGAALGLMLGSRETVGELRQLAGHVHAR